MQALISTGKGKPLKLAQVAKPALGKGEILVKVKAVALNPTDWKHRDGLTEEGQWLGCDFAGIVEEGSGGKVNKGDRVAGFVHGGRQEEVGSFAEYVKTEGALVWKVPQNVDWESAAALGGIGPHTAFQALYERLKLAHPAKPLEKPEPFLVWSGATSVGQYAIQLAKLSNYEVITTCSEASNDLVKSLGASDVYPYSDDSTPSKIAAKYPSLKKAIDTISEKGSCQQVAKSLGKEGGHIVTLLPQKEDANAGRSDVQVEPTLVYTVIGKAFNMGKDFPASPEDRKGIEEWLEYVPTLIESGKLKSNPLWSQKGGLASVEEGLELVKAGKNRGKKVTYSI